MPESVNQMERCRNSLVANGFEAWIVENCAEARALFFNTLLPSINPQTVAWGDSMTMDSTGVLGELEGTSGLSVIRTFEEGVPWRELIERRRKALLSDLFITGSNAVTECGKLVNLDMIGNRTAAIAFGPKKVVIFAGRNKITADLVSGMERVRNIAAPLNAKRHDFQTPCAKTGRCHDCSSPQRICNTWSIMEKSYPKGRIKVVLINQNLGL
jgi:hypothetical protein